MQNTWLITGPPGCGKTTWIRDSFLKHPGTCAYLRLSGSDQEGLEQGHNAGIDSTWLQDQIPELLDLATTATAVLPTGPRLVLIEVQQFQPPAISGLEGIDPHILRLLERFHLQPDRILHSDWIRNSPERTFWTSSSLNPGITIFRVVSGIPTASAASGLSW